MDFLPPQTIPLYPGGAPGAESWTQQETEDYQPDGLKVVRNVVQPTITVYLPPVSIASGTGIIVCPGGAWHFLAIDHEGTHIARWLNDRGVAAFVLRYRLIRTDDDFVSETWSNMQDPFKMEALMKPLRPLVLADGQQAVRSVRQRCAEWGISSKRIGMMGFSAGGMVTADVALQHDAESRPNFAAVIYGAPGEDLPAPQDAPPLFLLCAQDDDMANGVSLRLYSAWREGKHPVEMHIYAQGGHGFGLLHQGLPSDAWIERFFEWLLSIQPTQDTP